MDITLGNFFYTGKNKGMFLFFFLMNFWQLILSEKINVFLIRLNYKLILFSCFADNRNIYTTVCVYMWLWSVEYPI